MDEKTKGEIGVIGMAVMGRNLALNIESRGHAVSIYNRHGDKTDAVIKDNPDANLIPSHELKDFVDSLKKPRRILLMVKAGPGTDAVIKELRPLLDKGDVLIDAGNTNFKDTIRRDKELEEAGLHFIGTGVSGGEEGARFGPSIMPGGSKEAYDLIEPILTQIAAKANDGKPCVAYMGENGAGHYVKMVHNGIEYGDMQLIAESYAVMKHVLGLSNNDLGDTFEAWNKGELDSYLIEITTKIFRKKDQDTGKDLLDIVLDRAAQKGTGKWTSESALDLGVPLPLITEAVFARVLSSLKEERVEAAKTLKGPDEKFSGDAKDFIESVRRALYLAKIISYAQGFAQLRAAAAEYDWKLDYTTIAKIWRGGCIIRARFLEDIMAAFKKDAELPNLLRAPTFRDVALKYQAALREVVITATRLGVPVPGFSSAIAYYDGYRSERLPANLIQSQRDFFGAHTFERVDKEGSFHAEWETSKE